MERWHLTLNIQELKDLQIYQIGSGGVENNPFVLVFDLLNENGKLSKQDTIDIQALGEQAENILLVIPRVSGDKLTISSEPNRNQGAKSQVNLG